MRTDSRSETTSVGWKAPALLIAAGAMTGVALVDPSPITIGLGLVLALGVPGTAFAYAALPSDALDSGLTALGLGVVLTLSLYALVGLTLYALDLSLTRTAFLVAADAIVITACAVGLVTRGRRPRSELTVRTWLAQWTPPLTATVVAGVVVGVVASLPGADAAPYQALYPTAGGAAAGQPLQVTRGRASVALTVENHTKTARNYRLAGRVEGGNVWRGMNIRVPANGKWRGRLAGPVAAHGCSRRLRVELRAKPSGPRVNEMVLGFVCRE